MIIRGIIIDAIRDKSFVSDIAVEGERVLELAPGLGEKYPGAERIDASGKFIVPGLIDAHVHLGGSAGAAASAEEFTPEQFEATSRPISTTV